MTEQEARQQVVRAGLELVGSGLIARTWGNVSCRVDENTFIITPSGRPYETMTTDELVLCKVADASYEGEIKPSSEKGIHALVYRSRPEINFVIHTHQTMASAAAAVGLKKIPVENESLLGGSVPVAAYGLPGTKRLRKGVQAGLSHCTGKAVVMSHHGALCFGKDYEEAFAAARQLEESCERFLQQTYLACSKTVRFSEPELYCHYAFRTTKSHSLVLPSKVITLGNSRRTSDGFAMETEDGEQSFRFDDGNLPQAAQIHRAIYQRRSDISFIRQTARKGLLEISITGKAMKPLLDDFAQIIGTSARCSKNLVSEHVARALGRNFAVLVPGAGALCCAANASDAHAVEMVMEKGAVAEVSACLFEHPSPINPLECIIMHAVYQKSYSKHANSHNTVTEQ